MNTRMWLWSLTLVVLAVQSGEATASGNDAAFATELPFHHFYLPFECTGFCGMQALSGCWCDHHCFDEKDCCYGYKNACPNYQGSGPRVNYDPVESGVYYPHAGPALMTGLTWSEMVPPPGTLTEKASCQGKCGFQSSKINGDNGYGSICYCDQECHRKNDCCPDKVKFCGPEPFDRQQHENEENWEKSLNNQWSWTAGQAPQKFHTSSMLAFNLAASIAPPPVANPNEAYSNAQSSFDYNSPSWGGGQYGEQGLGSSVPGYGGYGSYNNGNAYTQSGGTSAGYGYGGGYGSSSSSSSGYGHGG